MVMTNRKPRLTYRQVLENVKALPLADQNRLRAELDKTPSVYILRPTRSPAAISSADARWGLAPLRWARC